MKKKAWAALLLPLQLGVAATTAEAKTIFADDFDAGDTVCWSSTVGASQAGNVGGAPGTAAACQTITDVSPDPTVSGSDITITGTGFGASQGASQVRYDGNEIAVGSWSDTSIEATLPIPETNGVRSIRTKARTVTTTDSSVETVPRAFTRGLRSSAIDQSSSSSSSGTMTSISASSASLTWKPSRAPATRKSSATERS